MLKSKISKHHQLDVVQRIRSTGPEVLIIVQPSLRRKSNKTLWVHKWNRLDKAPFRFHQTCSCKHGTEVQGCHLTCLIGSSFEMHLEPCGEVPTLSATSQAACVSLGSTLHHLLLSLPIGQRGPELVSVSLPALAQTVCHPVSVTAAAYPTPGPSRYQTQRKTMWREAKRPDST